MGWQKVGARGEGDVWRGGWGYVASATACARTSINWSVAKFCGLGKYLALERGSQCWFSLGNFERAWTRELHSIKFWQCCQIKSWKLWKNSGSKWRCQTRKLDAFLVSSNWLGTYGRTVRVPHSELQLAGSNYPGNSPSDGGVFRCIWEWIIKYDPELKSSCCLHLLELLRYDHYNWTLCSILKIKILFTNLTEILLFKPTT